MQHLDPRTDSKEEAAYLDHQIRSAISDYEKLTGRVWSPDNHASPECEACENNPTTERLGVPFCHRCADAFDDGFNNA